MTLPLDANRDRRIQLVFTDPPLDLNGDEILPIEAILTNDDLTVFMQVNTFLNTFARSALQQQPIPLDLKKPPHTIDLSGPLVFKTVRKTARLHCALCFGGTAYSITIRADKYENGQLWNMQTVPPALIHNPWKEAQWKEACGFIKHESLSKGRYADQPKSMYITSQCAVASILFDAIFPSQLSREPLGAGLILVTGGTGSGKTTIVNGILVKLLCRILSQGPERRPHVVTVGDPVESLFYADELGLSTATRQAAKASPTTASPPEPGARGYASNPIDYTARIIGTDIGSVRDALKDALRETPTVYIVSELRDEEDFKAVLAFAATGQLVIATAHNTSLVDAMRKLLMLSGGADNANNRSLLAQRVRAVIHLQPMNVEKQVITLPSVWLGNSSGIRNFVCDGLASVLPRGGNDEGSKENPGRAEERGSLGYYWAFVKLQAICAIHCTGNTTVDMLRKKVHMEDLKIR